MNGVTDVVLLAALVGDPVCKRNPELARACNWPARADPSCGESTVQRFVFASTCSNYGLREGDEPAAEEATSIPSPSTRRRRWRSSRSCSTASSPATTVFRVRPPSGPLPGCAST